jgi:hypothetical protein
MANPTKNSPSARQKTLKKVFLSYKKQPTANDWRKMTVKKTNQPIEMPEKS